MNRCACFLVFSLIALPAWAEQSLIFSEDTSLLASEQMPVVLTPARLRQPQSQVPASVTVIDRELIEASGAREIYQLMQLVPGMTALKVDGNVPTVSYHATQGRDVRRMQVIIDGRSQYQPGLARVLWNDLPIEIEDIERIEVTRGPASAAYGANAFEGVINIITRHPNDMAGTVVAVRYGNNGVRDWRVTSAAHADERAIRLTVASQSDDGYDGTYFDTDISRDVDMRDVKRAEKLNLRSVFELSAEDSIEFLAGGTQRRLQRLTEDADFYKEDILTFTDAPDEDAEQAFLQFIWEHRFSPQHQLKIQTYAQYSSGTSAFSGCAQLPGGSPDILGALLFSQEMRDIYEATGRDIEATVAQLEVSPEIGARLATLTGAGAGALCADYSIRIQEERYDFEVQDTIFIDDHTRLVMGANIRHDRARSATYTDGLVENVSRRLFGNLEIHLAEPLFLNLGGYWERDELNDRNFSPRTAVIYEFLHSHSVRFVMSESLRTADLYEDGAEVHLFPKNLNQPYASDPEGLLGWASPEFFVTQSSESTLQPEKIRSREIGYFGRFDSLEWDIRFYDDALRDLQSGSLNPFSFHPGNDGEVDINGREIQLSWRASAKHFFRVTGDHRHNHANNKQEGRVAVRDSASVLWRWDINEQWMFFSAGYLGNDYNELRYERADTQLLWKKKAAESEITIGGVIQQDLTNNEVVFEENVYSDSTRYWLSLAVIF